MLKQELTQERLKEALLYNPETGEFTALEKSYYRNIGDVVGTVATDKTRNKPTKYKVIRVDGQLYRAARLAMFYREGEWPNVVDHIDLNTLNDRYNNLRNCTSSQNSHNTAIYSTNSSGIKGVSLKRNPVPRYVGAVMVEGRQLQKTFSINKYGYKAKELAESWVRETRETVHRNYANHG